MHATVSGSELWLSPWTVKIKALVRLVAFSGPPSSRSRSARSKSTRTGPGHKPGANPPSPLLSPTGPLAGMNHTTLGPDEKSIADFTFKFVVRGQDETTRFVSDVAIDCISTLKVNTAMLTRAKFSGLKIDAGTNVDTSIQVPHEASVGAPSIENRHTSASAMRRDTYYMMRPQG
ncbi:hypothetical protein OH76DRAFT_1417706 [Lentinus brumalis]|uniref:Uncharacterized protein n=1 Tax=Lentinus brumalis TaxID=2498619 RepID=A0A371DDM7_9APHY|nr:hypothetical protein OH76DRAFT_1417706 [Polyporus brumalis]